MNVLITTTSFGKKSREMLKSIRNLNVVYNEKGKNYSKKEIIHLLKKYDPIGLIAGTEKYDPEVLSHCNNLKIISRVGIGLDSIDLRECKKRKILVKNTPDAPTNAVAEIVLGQMINLIRRIQESDHNLRKKVWKKYIGREIKDSAVGIIGCGRIGTSVFNKIIGFKPKKILVNDIVIKKTKPLKEGRFSNKEDLIKNCDIITIHIPINEKNRNYISGREFSLMKKNAVLLNFSRGEIVNEKDLYDWLKENPEARVAMDTFENEPYDGKLTKMKNCYLTPHIGGHSEKGRLKMEMGAVKNLLKELKLSK